MSALLETYDPGGRRQMVKTLRRLADEVERGTGIGELIMDMEVERNIYPTWNGLVFGDVTGIRWKLYLRTIGPWFADDVPLRAPIVDRDAGDESV